MVKDVVCGMLVDEKKTAVTSNYQAKTYYFCSITCKQTFEKPGGRFVVADFDWSHANLFYRLLGWPLRLFPMLRDHAAGRLDGYFRRAGFSPVVSVGRWGGFIVFYLSYKSKPFETGRLAVDTQSTQRERG